MNLQNAVDPLQVQKGGQYGNPMGSFYKNKQGYTSQHGIGQILKSQGTKPMKNRNGLEQDYNYLINIEKYGGGSGTATVAAPNMLSSVQTQGSLNGA